MRKGFLVRIKGGSFEGNNYIGSFSHLYNTVFGAWSYCGSSCNLIKTKVGRYCSIASHVGILFGDHPTTKWVSTHPAFYSTRTATGNSFTDTDLFEEYKYVDIEKRYYVEIGNDVWIGSDVKICSGVRIGDGAVIAAGAVVTNDVPPFCVVGGVPAKHMKYRFVSQDIEFLLTIKWWDKGESWIKEHSHLFNDIKTFKEGLSKETL